VGMNINDSLTLFVQEKVVQNCQSDRSVLIGLGTPSLNLYSETIIALQVCQVFSEVDILYVGIRCLT